MLKHHSMCQSPNPQQSPFPSIILFCHSSQHRSVGLGCYSFHWPWAPKGSRLLIVRDLRGAASHRSSLSWWPKLTGFILLQGPKVSFIILPSKSHHFGWGVLGNWILWPSKMGLKWYYLSKMGLPCGDCCIFMHTDCKYGDLLSCFFGAWMQRGLLSMLAFASSSLLQPTCAMTRTWICQAALV